MNSFISTKISSLSRYVFNKFLILCYNFKSWLFIRIEPFFHILIKDSYIFWTYTFNFLFFKKKYFFKKKKNIFNTIIKKKKNIFNTIRSNYFFFFFFNKTKPIYFYFYNFFLKNKIYKNQTIIYFTKNYKKFFGEGYLFIRGLVIIFFIDALITDDEPLWEPIEWSLAQTWIFFIFTFAWIAENLITSRYGSYTGRDKRVWFAWYKTFWLIEIWYAVSFGAASMLVIVPFYYELTYTVSFVFSWWNWYNRIFFFKFISTYTLVLLIAHLFQLNIKWLNWKKSLVFIVIINIFIGYLLYTQFIISFFSYFTDPLWYQKTRFIDYVQLSHEPLKWGWGPSKRDHFTYHRVSTVFWFKNDGPFAEAFLFINLFFFLTVFFLFIYWLTLLRRVYSTKELTYTFSTYCVSALRQFYYFFLFFYIFIFISFLVCYWRFPIEFLWIINASSWLEHFLIILKDYFFFLINII